MKFNEDIKRSKKMWAQAWTRFEPAQGGTETKSQKVVKQKKAERRLDISLREYSYR